MVRSVFFLVGARIVFGLMFVLGFLGGFGVVLLEEFREAGVEISCGRRSWRSRLFFEKGFFDSRERG